jgi:hypothetical protein
VGICREVARKVPKILLTYAVDVAFFVPALSKPRFLLQNVFSAYVCEYAPEIAALSFPLCRARHSRIFFAHTDNRMIAPFFITIFCLFHAAMETKRRVRSNRTELEMDMSNNRTTS